MNDPSRVRVAGPLGPHAEGFRGELAEQGYAPLTVVRQLQLMGHLSRWLDGRGLGGEWLTPAAVAAFLAERRAAGYATHRTGRGLEPLLGYLRRQGVAPEPAPPQVQPTPADELLSRYAGYLTTERGLAAVTIRDRVRLLRPFLAARESGGRLDLGRLAAGDVTAFLVASCRGKRGKSASPVATALRSLLRYLYLEGLTGQLLADAVPPVAAWPLTGLPKALGAGEVAALLASCDVATTVGRRDFAILMVLARLGLRAGEVAALSLDDIDWRRGEFTVRGKGNRCERLPLPADAGEAVVAYLAGGRPTTTGCREVFLRVRPPHGPMTRVAVTEVVAHAARRAGLGTARAHRLRHSAATEVLRAGGSLPEVGQLLRHHHTLTTAIYAKVDTEALRTLARPWPGGAA